MKYYEVGFDAGACYSCNIIQGETEAACRYAAEQHAKRYGYTVGYFEEIAESALEYNRKPVWSADKYPQPTEPEQEPETAKEQTEPEQPETEPAEADETEPETAEQTTPDGVTYHISENTEYNSREVYFSGKPAAETREAMKALKMRWNGKKSCWYGYATAEDIAAAIAGKIVSGAAKNTVKAEKLPKKNKFGVQVGDIFSASWGYDQTQTDFFQVVELVGELSVRVREVYPRMIGEEAVSPMSADRTYKITRDILPPAPHSVFIEDQERGDIKRLKSYDKDGKHPQFKLSSFANAYLCEGSTERTYESWYR